MAVSSADLTKNVAALGLALSEGVNLNHEERMDKGKLLISYDPTGKISTEGLPDFIRSASIEFDAHELEKTEVLAIANSLCQLFLSNL